MVAFNGSEPCGSAEEYYHDFLVDENDPSIPRGLRDHIKWCAHCQRRLARLRELLDGVGREPAGSAHEHAVIDHLEAHFRLLGERVTCAQVKRFLPSLLDASARIRVPTPVTVHIDQCPACAADLESLRALKLDDERLARLGHLYADGSTGGLWMCLRVQAKLSVGWRGSLEGMEHDVLDHLCVCPRCRRRVYQQRQRRLAGLGGPGAVCCGDTSSNDIFDLVVPYGNLDPEFEDERLRACGAHLRSCSICLKKAQTMYRVVYGILERPDSGVVTVCTACAKDPDEFDEGQRLYEGYPIHTEVLNAGQLAPEPLRLSRVAARLRPALKPTIMAAAIIPLLVALVFSTAPVSALSPRAISKIVNEAPNVRVLVFGEDATEAAQELWVSRSADLFTEETSQQAAVFDLARKEVLIKEADGVQRVMPMSQTNLLAIKHRRDGLLGLSLNNLLWSAELTKAETPVQGSDFQLYTLDWDDQNARPCRWEIYVDLVTGRPARAEFFAWDPIEEGLTRQETRCFEYPDEGEVRRHAEALVDAR